MGQFETILREMQRMSPEERDNRIRLYRTRCICVACPTYSTCMREKNELLFCVAGKSPTCTAERGACTCPTCPVSALLGLKKAYFCTRGSEKELRGL